MKRRNFLAGAFSIAVVSRAAAQTAGGPRKVAAFLGTAESDPESQKRIAAFRRGLTELGWKDGENVRIEYRWAAGRAELIRQYADELVAIAPDVILANSTPIIEALKSRTSSIPIVCALVIDPVGLGLVKSLSRPGGNITGFTFINPEIIGKWVGLLKEVTPAFTQASVLYNPRTTAFYRRFLQELASAKREAASEVAEAPVGSVDDIETAIDTLAAKPGSGLIIGPDPFTSVHIKRLAKLVQDKRLPAVSVHRQFAVEGGLMAYGPDPSDGFRRSAGYVDRILKGASPAELPVQQPDKFELIINQLAARSLGITVPTVLLATADQIIE